MNDSQIWSRLKNGDAEAINMIIRGYYSDMYFFGLKISQSKELTEDCIQELLVDLWEKRRKLSDVKYIKSYLFKSLRRRIIRVLSYDEPDIHYDPAQHDSFLNVQFSIEDQIINQQSNEQNKRFLLNALGNLSKRQREIIYLKFYEKLDYSEIAKIMSLKRQSVHNLLQESLKSLKRHIKVVSFSLILILSLFQ